MPSVIAHYQELALKGKNRPWFLQRLVRNLRDLLGDLSVRQVPDAIPAFDVVVGADVLYERPYGPVVARAIASTLAEGGRALIADPGRVGSPAFFEALHDVGLKHVGASVTSVALNGRDHAITVHDIAR